MNEDKGMEKYAWDKWVDTLTLQHGNYNSKGMDYRVC